MNIHKLAKFQPGSAWISDRPKICGEDCVLELENRKKNILVVEKDASLHIF